MWDFQAIVIVVYYLTFQNRIINNNEPYPHSRFNTYRLTKKLYSYIGMLKYLIKHWSKFSLLMY